jgi:RNA polymerase sigma-70 factor (ECF subfamily)
VAPCSLAAFSFTAFRVIRTPSTLSIQKPLRGSRLSFIAGVSLLCEFEATRKSHCRRDDEVQRSLKRSADDRDEALHDVLFAESQKGQIRMRGAINFRRIGAAFGLKSSGLKDHSRPNAQRLLRKGKRASVSEHTSVGLKPHKPDSSPVNEAVRLAQDGDPGAFEIIYQQHSRRVYALCLRMLRDPIEAEDLVQDVFMQLFRKIHTFRGESAFSTWLHRLAVNLVLMRLRKKSPSTVSIDATVDLDDETSSPAVDVGAPDLLLEGSIDRVNLERCIGRLPAGYRAIFVLHDIQGYQHDEIAAIVGRSVGDSKSQLHKARMRLRELLHEVQREKLLDERLAGRKLRSRSRTALFPLTANNA